MLGSNPYTSTNAKDNLFKVLGQKWAAISPLTQMGLIVYVEVAGSRSEPICLEVGGLGGWMTQKVKWSLKF